MNKEYKGIFKRRYPELKGRDWLSRISAEDKQAFIKLGLQCSEYGRLGGLVRAKNGKRDHKGRFIKES